MTDIANSTGNYSDAAYYFSTSILYYGGIKDYESMENTYIDAALKRLRVDKGITDSKEKAMAPAVRQALEGFCGQDAEFAQAVAQGGSFADCMKAVAKGCGTSISDLEAYGKAVSFYFPGAKIRMKMTIDLIGDAAKGTAAEPEDVPAPKGLILDLSDFL